MTDERITRNEEFRDWMSEVDVVISRVCGLTSNDIADWRWRDAFEDGTEPKEAAMEALAEDGFPMDAVD